MRKSTEERFWEKVDKRGKNECWVWTATRTPAGYGHFRLGSLTDGTRRKEMSHRLAYMLTTGQAIPKGAVIMHSCDNPPCCNPAHLSVGTYAENGKAAYDRKRRGSLIKPGENSPRAILTAKDVEYIREVGYAKSARELAAELGVGMSTITAVRTGQNWGKN